MLELKLYFLLFARNNLKIFYWVLECNIKYIIILFMQASRKLFTNFLLIKKKKYTLTPAGNV